MVLCAQYFANISVNFKSAVRLPTTFLDAGPISKTDIVPGYCSCILPVTSSLIMIADAADVTVLF